jgi:alkylation response protein AidB-like acyl-CoA dehydrogenase
MFDNGWLLPGYNPQGVGIISASLISFGTEEQQRRWAVPILRGEMTASLGMSEPAAGSDLASLRTGAVRDGDDFVVNGQKVWTSGAHDAEVLLTFVRTDPTAPKHKGISAVRAHHRRGNVRNPTQHHCPASAGLAQKLRTDKLRTDVEE